MALALNNHKGWYAVKQRNQPTNIYLFIPDLSIYLSLILSIYLSPIIIIIYYISLSIV